MGLHGFLMYFIPVFAVMIAAEAVISHRRSLKLYTKGETVASLWVIIIQRLTSLVPLSFVGFVADKLYARKLFDIPTDSWWYIPVLFLGVEFFYYWFHRLSHEVRWLWATHSVHHSIEEMNILGAYRFGWTERITAGGLVFSPMYLAGFEPVHVVGMLAMNLMYQSWLHTTLIGKLGPLEGVINTPSAHRVHHAKNADYLDRNHGGVLMIFDHMFGTYEAERNEEAAQYGLVSPSGSHNPFKIALHEWINMFHDLRRFSIRHWPMLIFGPPGWKPNGEGMTSAQMRAAYKAAHNKSETPDIPEAIIQPAE